MTEPESLGQARCWVLSDGKAGTEVQSLGLAEALGFEPEIKRIAVRAPWRWLPPGLWIQPLRSLAPDGAPLAPPWPEVLIASGRLTAAPALAVRRAGRGGCFTIQIQDPKVAPRRFDLVVAPRHDRLSGANVVSMLGALHRVTPRRLAEAAARHGPDLAYLPRPRVAVLIGGTSRAYRMTPLGARRLGAQLASLARDQGAGLMITVSRRTEAANEAALRAALEGVPAAFWDGRGANPYLGYLALADALIVTADSVTMISEAAATGRPVHVAALEGGSAKFRRFHAAMREAGITRPFAGRIEAWSYARLDETGRIAAEVKRRLEAHCRPP
jgi:mitochondrial fission protein ELM1